MRITSRYQVWFPIHRSTWLMHRLVIGLLLYQASFVRAGDDNLWATSGIPGPDQVIFSDGFEPGGTPAGCGGAHTLFADGFEPLSGLSITWPPEGFQGNAWDTTLAATLGRAKSGPASAVDPIYMDLDQDGNLNITGGMQVRFDINGDGILDTVHEWNSRDGQLVIDANCNGIVDDGREIMNETGIDGQQNMYPNGWAKARALFDENQDGIIDGAELDRVTIWVDSNADGISDKNELASAAKLSIVSIHTVNRTFTAMP